MATHRSNATLTSPFARTLEGILPYLAWAQALVATTGSLFFSEVMGFVPCVLCWYQRIAMYPLVAILAVGIVRRDRGIHAYVLPSSVIGLVVAAYHNLLSMGVIPEAASVCRAGVSCTTRYFEWFGFITIPFLSLTAFAVITTLMLIHWRLQSR
jgi:disulfide bond formation protein DsbB